MKIVLSNISNKIIPDENFPDYGIHTYIVFTYVHTYIHLHSYIDTYIRTYICS